MPCFRRGFQVKRKQTTSGVYLGDDVLALVIEPQVDRSLIVALVAVYASMCHRMWSTVQEEKRALNQEKDMKRAQMSWPRNCSENCWILESWLYLSELFHPAQVFYVLYQGESYSWCVVPVENLVFGTSWSWTTRIKLEEFCWRVPSPLVPVKLPFQGKKISSSRC